jgi:Cu/Ag efflux protein CusF
MKTSRIVVVLALVVCCFVLAAGLAAAEEKVSVKGKIKAYDLEAKTVTVVTDDNKEMTFVVKSDKALQKLDDRLFKGDEVKVRYIIKDGKNLIQDTNDLKGTKPGC